MTHFDVFNGDADGLCALVQLRLQHPLKTTLVTGVKRDIQLLERISVSDGDTLTVLDVSLDSNRARLMRLLEHDVRIDWFDHHFAEPIPVHPRLGPHIDTDPDTCTSLIINRYLGGAQHLWAIVGTYGDNLQESAERLAETVALPPEQRMQLRQLGEALNYNAYGESIADLRCSPDALFHLLLQAENPFAFINDFAQFGILRKGFNKDMAAARRVGAYAEDQRGAIFILPDIGWARRVSGAFANELAVSHPDRAHAILTHRSEGGYTVSVRAPKSNPIGADQLCRRFPTGGGRMAAAGINCLPGQQLDVFANAFAMQYGGIENGRQS